MAAAAILTNRKIAITLQQIDRFDEIWHSDSAWPFLNHQLIKFENLWNPRWQKTKKNV